MGIGESEQCAGQRVPKLPESKQGVLQQTHAQFVGIITVFCAWRAGRPAHREGEAEQRMAIKWLVGRCTQAGSVLVVEKKEIRGNTGIGDICNLAMVWQA
jgi:hypothetical protein